MKIILKIAVFGVLPLIAACGGMGTEKPASASISLEMVDTPVDPVCRMNMTGLPIADTLTYEGKTYPLCNAKCKEQFAADPAAYVRAADPEPELHEGHEHETESGS